MNQLKKLFAFIVIISVIVACEKSDVDLDDPYTYYEVGMNGNRDDWRDTMFVVRTKNQQLIQQADAQLALPIEQRQLVVGPLKEGSGGFNKNGSHEFKWHLEDDAWNLADVTVEIYDGSPYSEVDQNIQYWLTTVKSYGPWASYIKRRLPGKP